MKKLSRKTCLIIAGGTVGLCIICGVIGLIYSATPAGKAVNAASTQQALAMAMTETAKPTNTPQPSNTPIPSSTVTNTPLPTATPLPTKTNVPTATETPLPTPLTFSGTGDDVVDFDKSSGPAIMDVKYSGAHNFIIQADDANGNMIDLPVNTIGSYAGKLPLDFAGGENNARLEITASGKWEITVSPLSVDVINTLNVPGKYDGNGDDVVRLMGSLPSKVTFDCPGQHNFIVWTYSNSSGEDLTINAIAPYHGVKAIPGDAFLIVINATGAWSVDMQ